MTHLLTADKIHNGHHFLPASAAIEVDDESTIIAIHEDGHADATLIEGILCPGFINAHCHLELSHLKDVIPQKTGLIPFLQGVMRLRFDFTDEQRKAARHEAYATLIANGTVAVGDIANTVDTLDLRAQGTMHFHTFSECIGFTESGAEGRLGAAREVYEAFTTQQEDAVLHRQSITPHAPYSVSQKLFGLISAALPESLLSIHNQESAAENEYYEGKTGAVKDLLSGFNIDDTFFRPSANTSLQTYLPWIAERHPLILVHNTFSSSADIEFARKNAPKGAFWCLCPGANLYIEDTLPDVEMLAMLTDEICIGTDSLASNTQLNVIAELSILNQHFPQIGWETLLRWATLNGAKALQMEHIIGGFEPGKKPGLVQIIELTSSSPIARPLDLQALHQPD